MTPSPHTDSSASARLTRGNNSRWYDQEPVCRQVIDLLQQMENPTIQLFAANLVCQLANEVHNTLRLRSGSAPKTLGLSGIKETYLSRNQNKRWYDHTPQLKQAIGRFYTLPLNGLTALCFKLYEPLNLLALYSFICQQIGQQPQEEELTNIVRSGLFESTEQAEQTLIGLVGQDLYTALLSEYPVR
jgi:hypothetical protein